MTRKEDSAISNGDMMVNFGAIMLAITSAGFAGYVIFVAPQARVSTQQLAPTQVLASVNREPSDPIITGSIDRAASVPDRQRYSILSKPEKANLRHYKIRSYTNDMAIIDFTGKNLTHSVKIKVGDYVPGFGHILSIDNRNGNWFLVTDQGTIADEGFVKMN
jgi:hypothetical protein